MDYGEDEQLHFGAAYYVRSAADTADGVPPRSAWQDTEDEQLRPRRRSEARFVARRIRQLLDEGYPVQEADGQLRPVRPEDIVILMRSPRHAPAGVHRRPCAGSGYPLQPAGSSRPFFATTEIAVLVSFLQIVDNPRQDVPLHRGAALAAVRLHAGPAGPDPGAAFRRGTTTALCVPTTARIAVPFWQRLAQLRAAAGELTADRLLWKLYTDWQALAVFGAMEGGAQRRSNLAGAVCLRRAAGGCGTGEPVRFCQLSAST